LLRFLELAEREMAGLRLDPKVVADQLAAFDAAGDFLRLS
jgi:hypothetical protein